MKTKFIRRRWDSEFWDINIYDLEHKDETSNIEKEIKDVTRNRPFVIQRLVTEENIEHINWLEDHNFRFVESKVTMIKKVENKMNFPEKGLYKDVEEEELAKYENDFYSLYGKVSRFSLLGKKKLNEFYYEWASKSIRGELDHKCVGYYSDDLEGFITYKIVNQDLVIGLLGVFPKFQGRGVSQKLLTYINNIAIETNCTNIYVATQGKNTKALNAYISSGFYIENIKQWYYLTGGL